MWRTLEETLRVNQNLGLGDSLLCVTGFEMQRREFCEPLTFSYLALMKFMLLVHHDEISFAARPDTERQGMIQESVQLANQLHSNGQYIGAAPLHPSGSTACVRMRDGQRVVTDGPFAETREQIGGYFLVDCRDVDEAIEIASRIPGARIGTVEVRQLTEVEGLPGE